MIHAKNNEKRFVKVRTNNYCRCSMDFMPRKLTYKATREKTQREVIDQTYQLGATKSNYIRLEEIGIRTCKQKAMTTHIRVLEVSKNDMQLF